MPESQDVLIVEPGTAKDSSHEDWTIIPEKLLLIPVVKRPPDEDSPLRRWMDAHGCSLWFLSQRVGVSKRAVQLWYTGRCIPELTTAFKLQKVTADFCKERGCHSSALVRVDSWLGTRVGRAQWKELEAAEGKKGMGRRRDALEKEKVS